MGQTHKRRYDRYTLEYKLQAVKLANNLSVKAKDVAQSLGIHTVMLYRWRIIGDRPRLIWHQLHLIVVCPRKLHLASVAFNCGLSPKTPFNCGLSPIIPPSPFSCVTISLQCRNNLHKFRLFAYIS